MQEWHIVVLYCSHKLTFIEILMSIAILLYCIFKGKFYDESVYAIL